LAQEDKGEVMKQTEVVIAGGGPVGSVAAYILARAGIEVVLLEAHPTSPTDLRASTMHPPTLELFERLGIAQDLIAQGLKAPIYQYRDRASETILSFDLSELADMTQFPFRLQCEQYKLARLLADRLDALPTSEVRFNTRVVAFDQDSDGVDVHVETPFAIETYRAKFLLGCDGANSIVRKWLGFEFDGFTYPEKFLTLSTKWPLEQHFKDLSYVNYVSDPDEWVVLLRVPEFWRVLVPADETQADSYLVSDEKKNLIFQNLIGHTDAVQTGHRTIYRVHQRVAKRYFEGRVVIAGDAAHLNNPLGGLGMNSGIHDVANLCDKLIAILRDKADRESRLSHYERQRRSVMQSFVQSQTISNKADMEAKNTGQKRSRQAELEAILIDDDRRRDFLMTQSMFKSLQQEAAIA
jgi:3-(3-hydroxy-phenyl)propionate hydroxylase